MVMEKVQAMELAMELELVLRKRAPSWLLR
jgi:hypothetical protein